jgi:hypothetical protein
MCWTERIGRCAGGSGLIAARGRKTGQTRARLPCLRTIQTTELSRQMNYPACLCITETTASSKHLSTQMGLSFTPISCTHQIGSGQSAQYHRIPCRSAQKPKATLSENPQKQIACGQKKAPAITSNHRTACDHMQSLRTARKANWIACALTRNQRTPSLSWGRYRS